MSDNFLMLMLRRLRALFFRSYNAVRGYGFTWRDGTYHPWRGTCPYPIRNDWSAKACIAAGYCGCDERKADERGEK